MGDSQLSKLVGKLHKFIQRDKCRLIIVWKWLGIVSSKTDKHWNKGCMWSLNRTAHDQCNNGKESDANRWHNFFSWFWEYDGGLRILSYNFWRCSHWLLCNSFLLQVLKSSNSGTLWLLCRGLSTETVGNFSEVGTRRIIGRCETSKWVHREIVKFGDCSS